MKRFNSPRLFFSFLSLSVFTHTNPPTTIPLVQHLIVVHYYAIIVHYCATIGQHCSLMYCFLAAENQSNGAKSQYPKFFIIKYEQKRPEQVKEPHRGMLSGG